MLSSFEIITSTDVFAIITIGSVSTPVLTNVQFEVPDNTQATETAIEVAKVPNRVIDMGSPVTNGIGIYKTLGCYHNIV